MLKKVVIAGISVLFVVSIAVVFIGGEVAFAFDQKSKCKKSAAFSTCKKDQCKTACSTAGKCCCRIQCEKCREKTTTAIRKVSTGIPYHESKRLVLTGEYLCGKCSLSKLEFCQGFVKTVDGNIYPLLKNAKVKKMSKMAHKKSDNKFEIVGKVKVSHGVKFIQVTKFKKL